MSNQPTEQSFLKDVAQHQMQVIRDDGINRHIRFKAPNTMCEHFDLITWAGALCYTGDMGTYVFRRLEDMFDFFRQRPGGNPAKLHINTGYWAEKVIAQDRDGVREYSYERFEQRLRAELEEYIKNNGEGWDAGFADELRQEFEEDVAAHSNDGEHNARTAAAGLEVDGDPVFADMWEYDFSEYTYRFVWCCYALAWGIKQYDLSKQEQPA